MTFLEKFKGKTQLLTRQDVSGILGGTSSQSYVNYLISQAISLKNNKQTNRYKFAKKQIIN
jgi:hypothetical protein